MTENNGLDFIWSSEPCELSSLLGPTKDNRYFYHKHEGARSRIPKLMPVLVKPKKQSDERSQRRSGLFKEAIDKQKALQQRPLDAIGMTCKASTMNNEKIKQLKNWVQSSYENTDVAPNKEQENPVPKLENFMQLIQGSQAHIPQDFAPAQVASQKLLLGQEVPKQAASVQTAPNTRMVSSSNGMPVVVSGALPCAPPTMPNQQIKSLQDHLLLPEKLGTALEKPLESTLSSEKKTGMPSCSCNIALIPLPAQDAAAWKLPEPNFLKLNSYHLPRKFPDVSPHMFNDYESNASRRYLSKHIGDTDVSRSNLLHYYRSMPKFKDTRGSLSNFQDTRGSSPPHSLDLSHSARSPMIQGSITPKLDMQESSTIIQRLTGLSLWLLIFSFVGVGCYQLYIRIFSIKAIGQRQRPKHPQTVLKEIMEQ